MAGSYVTPSLNNRKQTISKLLTLLVEQDSPETPFIRAERYRLRNWLSTNLPIQWGKRLQHIEHNDNGVTAYFEDGTSSKGDILVGADGIKSVGKLFIVMIDVLIVLFAVLLLTDSLEWINSPPRAPPNTPQ